MEKLGRDDRYNRKKNLSAYYLSSLIHSEVKQVSILITVFSL